MLKKNLMKKSNKVVPFDQEGEFYYKKAQKYIDNNNYINALSFYRKALEKEPENLEYQLDLAEIYTEMNYYDESNQILFHVIQTREDVKTECYFGLGCNFMGLLDYEKAEECFKKYIESDPDGEFSIESQELIDILQNQDYIWDDPELNFNENAMHVYKMANKGKKYLDQGDYKKAIKQLEKVLKKAPDLIFVKNNLSLAYFCNHQVESAIKLADEVLKIQPQNIHSTCNLVLFYKETGDTEKEKKYFDDMLKFDPDDPEEIYKIAVTLCEVNNHKEAENELKKLLQYMPYDKKIIQYTAISCFNQNKIKEAIKYWNKIVKLDPMNTIADYYKNYALNFLKKGITEKNILAYKYQVPYNEILYRIKYINEVLKDPLQNTNEKWKNDDKFRALIAWGIELNDITIKKALINLLASFKDEKAEHLMRRFLLKRNESDSLKKIALALLKQMDAREPYIVYMKKGIMEVRVNVLNMDGTKIPSDYHKILDIVLKKMYGSYNSEYMNEVIDLWQAYIKSITPDFKKIRSKNAWAAALEYYYLKSKNIKVTKSKICVQFKTSVSSLNRIVLQLKESLDKVQKEGKV